MSQISKRKAPSNAKAGQYMCPECGQLFNDKESVDSHIHMMHDPHIRTVHGSLHSHQQPG